MSVTSAAFHVETCVIGAGVIGLAFARALAQKGMEVLVLDRAPMIGSETSSRNSEVIHAGLYYPQASLKGKFCVRGKQLMYDYCKSRHLPYKQCGKLVVATNESQWKHDLPKMKKQAIMNGVLDVELYSPTQVQDLEPQVDCFGALWSPSTGVLDSHSFMVSLLADAEHHEATLALNSNVENAFMSSNGGITLKVDDTLISCKTLVNSAGLWADEIARMIHHDTDWQPPRQYFAKGNYFRLEGVKTPFRHLVYPVPQAAGLGVHATIDYAGQSVKFGPDVEWLDQDASPDDIDMTPDPSRCESFYSAIRKYWPALPDDSLVPDYSGVRPKLSHPKVPTNVPADFYIAGSKQHGIPGLIHLLGMESPGLTATMAIAEYVSDLLAKDDC